MLTVSYRKLVASTNGDKPELLKDPISCDFSKSACEGTGDGMRAQKGYLDLSTKRTRENARKGPLAHFALQWKRVNA